ncbi:tetratricopeptide repeat protein [Flavobacterium rhizosphaerae]|uniref:Tetratricopeptide repeat protein n=1 Tax=Flavobacterium rhizosphaerae TaxID=3163298 RepID=A0ABW8YSY3_9FLAO
MKTKHTLLWFLAMVFPVLSSAQAFKCEEAFNSFQEKTVSANYKEAAVFLQDLRKSCPKYDVKLYILGQEVLHYTIEASRTPEEKQKNIDNLISLYTEQERNFPYTGGSVNKALLLYENKLADGDEVYKMLDAAATLHPESFTDYKAIETYFNLYLKQYEGGEKGINQLDFIEKYSMMAGQLAGAKKTLQVKERELKEKEEAGVEPLEYAEKKFLANAPLALNAFDAVKDNMHIQASEYFTCDNLEAYYGQGYDKKKDDAAWLQGLVASMYDNKCYQSAVLEKAAVRLQELQPDVNTLFILGNLSLRNNKQAYGIAYFDKAASLEDNPKEKAELYGRIAGIYRNIDRAQAKQYIQKAIDLDRASGKNYLFLAELYSTPSKDCPLDDFEKKALLWLAVDAARKAEVAEPRYKPTVASLMNTYNKKLPTRADLKASKYKSGDTVTFGCWINETVTIPKL